MEDNDDDNQPPAQPVEYAGASRGELLEALKFAQQENTNLRAEVRTLRKENSDLLAVSSKKRRGRTDDKLGYKSEVIAWSKRFLFTRALCIDISIFSAKPSEFAADPAATFATDDLYIESLTVADIPEKFHELLDANQYSNLAKDFIREHGDARSSLLNSVRKALPTILKGLDVDFDLLTTAGADRSNNAILSGLLKFPNERKPTLYAPVLFPGPNQNMTELFLGPAVKKRAIVLLGVRKGIGNIPEDILKTLKGPVYQFNDGIHLEAEEIVHDTEMVFDKMLSEMRKKATALQLAKLNAAVNLLRDQTDVSSLVDTLKKSLDDLVAQLHADELNNTKFSVALEIQRERETKAAKAVAVTSAQADVEMADGNKTVRELVQDVLEEREKKKAKTSKEPTAQAKTSKEPTAQAKKKKAPPKPSTA
ncbi:hypothetical protein B0H11DRAFT_2226543 [Mycena galericulata]|nr:hypothetical protein B0H11DRAFT_2226543 [Mycena galericulata]